MLPKLTIAVQPVTVDTITTPEVPIKYTGIVRRGWKEIWRGDPQDSFEQARKDAQKAFLEYWKGER